MKIFKSVIVLILLQWLVSAAYGQELFWLKGEPMQKRIAKAQSLRESMPLYVYDLFQWPTETELLKKKIINNDTSSSMPLNQRGSCFITLYIAKEWLPKTDLKYMDIRDDIGDIDTNRSTWETHGYRVHLTQTGCLFAIELIPLDKTVEWKTKAEKINITLQTCNSLFNVEDPWLKSVYGKW